MNRSKQIGTRWESAIVNYLQQWWPHVERRALNGAKDKGDVAGVIGVMIEAKSASRIALAEWMKELQAEKANANAPIGVVWIRRRGKPDPGDAYVLMDGNQFVQLLHEAGYAPDSTKGTIPNQSSNR